MSALDLLDRVDRDVEAARVATLTDIRSRLNGAFHTACLNIQRIGSALPDPDDTSWLNIFTSAAEQAQTAIGELRAEVTKALCCIQGLVQAEEQLNGGEPARRIFEQLLSALKDVVPMADVQDKARRLPTAKGVQGPDRFWIDLDYSLDNARVELDRAIHDGGNAISVEVAGHELLKLA